MYIVAIMITALVFSITGIGVLDLGRVVTENTQIATDNMQAQVEMESFMNVALWRLNTGADSLATFSSGAVSSQFDSTTKVLSVQYSAGEIQTGYTLDLSEDSHFKRAVASRDHIDFNGNSVNEGATHKVRENMGFMPQVDVQYFLDHADTIFYGNWRDYGNSQIREGINVFYGSYLDIENIDKENTTLVFFGYNIEFKGDTRLVAPVVNGVPLPAVVLTNPYTDLHLDADRGKDLHIEGAIFSNGYVRLHEADISGPVVANHVRFCRDIDMLDDQYSQYYTWNAGFGEYDSYDWPKQIAMWESQ